MELHHDFGERYFDICKKGEIGRKEVLRWLDGGSHEWGFGITGPMGIAMEDALKVWV